MTLRLALAFVLSSHPLSDTARSVLRFLCAGPIPAQLFNSGVVNRLLREDLVEIVQLPSPYKTNKGTLINYLKITRAGLDEIS